MAIDIYSGVTTAGTTGVGLQIQDPTTHILDVAGITTAGTTTTSSATTSGAGLQLHDPTLYSSSYGTGITAALATAVPVIFVGAALLGVGLLTYAITKAALEPQS